MHVIDDETMQFMLSFLKEHLTFTQHNRIQQEQNKELGEFLTQLHGIMLEFSTTAAEIKTAVADVKAHTDLYQAEALAIEKRVTQLERRLPPKAPRARKARVGS